MSVVAVNLFLLQGRGKKMSGVIHTFVDNSFGIGHGAENCVCKPAVSKTAKPVARGRHGRHQGYKYNVTVKHNVLPKS
jgi:hypothetical protein